MASNRRSPQPTSSGTVILACVGTCDTSRLARLIARTVARRAGAHAFAVAGIAYDLDVSTARAIRSAHTTVVINGCNCRCIERYLDELPCEALRLSLADMGFARGSCVPDRTVEESAVTEVCRRLATAPGTGIAHLATGGAHAAGVQHA